SSIPTALSHFKGGKLRALAVTSSKRVPTLPDVPTIAEAGYKGFDANTWFGIVAPSGTPPGIINKLSAEINRALSAPDIREKFATEGGGALGSTPQQFAVLLMADYGKWGKVVKDSGMKID